MYSPYRCLTPENGNKYGRRVTLRMLAMWGICRKLKCSRRNSLKLLKENLYEECSGYDDDVSAVVVWGDVNVISVQYSILNNICLSFN